LGEQPCTERALASNRGHRASLGEQPWAPSEPWRATVGTERALASNRRRRAFRRPRGLGRAVTTNTASAVIVLAAGAGTRMRSDTPKVLHPLAGRSILSHALHSVAKVAPAHLVVLLGYDRDRVAPAVAELADALGRPILVAVQEQQLGTGHAVGCALSALPDDFTGTVVVTYGDVPLLDADTLAG